MSTASYLKTLAADVETLKATLGALVKTVNDGAAASFTIQTFCRRNQLSQSQFFKLQREGRGPRTMSTGDVGVRISRAAEADWIVEREREAAAKQSAGTRRVGAEETGATI